MALRNRLETILSGGGGSTVTGREYEESSGRLGMLYCLMWVLSVSPEVGSVCDKFTSCRRIFNRLIQM